MLCGYKVTSDRRPASGKPWDRFQTKGPGGPGAEPGRAEGGRGQVQMRLALPAWAFPPEWALCPWKVSDPLDLTF